MSRPQSRARRQAAFMEGAQRMYEQLEEWYDAHPQASFGEIEEEARKRRRELMGKALTQLVNGRDTGAQIETARCTQCGGKMEFEGYRDWGIHGLEGDSTLERAYYVCPDCKGETFFPLGHKIEIADGSLERGCSTRGYPAGAVGEVI